MAALRGVGFTLTFFNHAGRWALKAALALTAHPGITMTPNSGPRPDIRLSQPKTLPSGIKVWDEGRNALRFTGSGLQLSHASPDADLTGPALEKAVEATTVRPGPAAALDEPAPAAPESAQ